MQNLALIAPLIILLPTLGTIINFFWGPRLNERFSSLIGIVAAGSTFVITLVLFSSLNSNYYQAVIVDPPLLDGWIRIPSIGLEIPWQMRIDTLSVGMLSFVTFVGTLIHIYASGYMHGDPRFSRFFAYLNMFLAFMIILVTGNNLLMLFVGWEGVGLCSYLLIGFWWEKKNGEGIRNANAARKAMIANRIGDFGLLMAIFLTFWTFGTLDFYKPTEVANPHMMESLASGGGHGEETDDHAEEAAPAGEEVPADDHEGAAAQTVALRTDVTVDQEGEHEETPVGEGEHAAEDEHAVVDEHAAEEDHGPAIAHTDNSHLTPAEMGIFGQAEYLLHLDADQLVERGDGTLVGRTVHFGGLEVDIDTVITLITLFMLLGAAGKSAQIPLFVWLPDAMAGPTPVSALIHAATMVTAGVYMMVRANVFFHEAEFTSFIVAVVGTSTAIVAGFIAIGQFDIKRVLAYSTVSQLGFMVAAVGIGAYGAAMFHMITHAFFKALLFLGSGSVIHGMEHGHHHVHGHAQGHDDHATHDEHRGDEHDVHEAAKGHVAHAHEDVPHTAAHDEHHAEPAFDPQDMRNMGGLRRRMPITYVTYVIGTLALAGIWPFAGFWSKDEILADSVVAALQDGNPAGFVALGLFVAAVMTAFYMWRQIEMVFHSEPRTDAADAASESTWSMTTPLIILAVFTAFIGFVNIPSGLDSFPLWFLHLGTLGIFGEHTLATWLEYSVVNLHVGTFMPLIALTAFALAVAAIFVARRFYGGGKAIDEHGLDPLQAGAGTRGLFGVANARMYWDETYNRLFIVPFQRVSSFLADRLDWAFWHDYVHDTVIWKGFNGMGKLLSQPVDMGIIDGAVNGVGRLVRGVSGTLRRSQTGYVRVYALALLVGVVAVIVLMLLPVL
jgi:NADH-quinone oxidoreductase subunit L